jgi:hypothetical protein
MLACGSVVTTESLIISCTLTFMASPVDVGDSTDAVAKGEKRGWLAPLGTVGLQHPTVP